MTAVRIGLLGGTFDPPHAAHLALAQCAIQDLGLQSLRVLPTGNPWHRAFQPSLATHRVAMCRMAFAQIPQALVDDRETRREGPTYTIDTVRELRTEFPQAEWFLIIGADQARRFQTWKNWEELLGLVHLVVADRNPEAPQWQNTPMIQARRLPFEPMDISATAIRHRLSQGLSVDGLHPLVQEYVQRHQLYLSQTP